MITKQKCQIINFDNDFQYYVLFEAFSIITKFDLHLIPVFFFNFYLTY